MHERGWADTYLIHNAGSAIGYLSVFGSEDRAERDSIFEYYLLPDFRRSFYEIIKDFLDLKNIIFIETQTNEFLLTSALYECSRWILPQNILFEYGKENNLLVQDAFFRKITNEDVLFQHSSEPEGEFGIEFKNCIVATGGYLHHYNKPYVDLYMEVHPDFRNLGFGSFLIQEIMKDARSHGYIPAARCGMENKASKNTLIKGGMKIV